MRFFPRIFVCLGLSLMASVVQAESVTHKRGEFEFDVGPAPAFVEVREIATNWPAEQGVDTAERWRNWMMDGQIDRRGGRSVAYVDRAYEPITVATVDDAAKFDIDFVPQYQKLILHRVELRRDGKWQNRLDPDKVSLARRESGFEENMADGNVTALIVLEDIRPRDVVRISYTIEGSNPILAGNIVHPFRLGWIDPILENHGRVLFDTDVAPAIQRIGTAVAVTQKRSADALELSFDAPYAKAIPDRGDYPVWYSPFPLVQIGPKRSWSDIVEWALPLYPETSALPAELEARLQEWRQLPDPYRQAEAVLRLAQDDVRYFGAEMGENTHKPNPPELTWSRRYGDCKDKTYLTVTLLRRLGLEAEPALVSTGLGRGLSDWLPAASDFNHVIVRLRIGKQTLWLDPTMSEQRGPLLQRDVPGYGVALPIRAGASALVPVEAPSGAKSDLAVLERFVPRADGKQVELYIETRYTGFRAMSARQRLRANRAEKTSQDFSEYYRKRYGEVTVATPLSVREEDATDTLILTEHYLLADPWNESGSSSRSMDVYAEALQRDAQLPDSMSRQEPMSLSRPSNLRHEVRVELPPQWVLSNLPARIAIDGPPVTYNRTLSQSGNVVTLVHQMEVREDYVDEKAVGHYLSKLRDIKNSLGVSLHVGLPTQVRDKDRDRRLRSLLQDAMNGGGKE